MPALVDTDVLIDVQRGYPPALAWFAGLKELPGVPGYVVMELIQDARRIQDLEQAWQLVAPLRQSGLPQQTVRLPFLCWLTTICHTGWA